MKHVEIDGLFLNRIRCKCMVGMRKGLNFKEIVEEKGGYEINKINFVM